MDEVKSCPRCGGTMLFIDYHFNTILGYWWCMNCYYTMDEPVVVRTLTSDNTSVSENDNTKDWREE